MQESDFKLLIVDDSHSIIETALVILKPLSLRMDFAHNGKEALEKIALSKPDLLLLDITMPLMDGYKVCQKIKSSPLLGDITIIFLTADLSQASLVKAFEYGAVDYICKPFYGKELFLRVKTQLQNIASKRYFQQELNSLLAEKEKLQSLTIQQSKMTTFSDIASSILHQWKQPLSNISASMSTSRIKESLKKDPDQELLKRLDFIDTQLEFMLTTMKDFQNFFQLQSEKKPFSLSKALYNVELLLKNALFKDKIVLSTHLEDQEDIDILGHENMLKQVVLNIILNARDAIIQDEPENRTIDVIYQVEKNYLIIAIRDYAKAIDEKALPRIFDQYFTTKESSGMGIGLYLSLKIIQDMFHGDIVVENKSNAVCFKLRLPLASNLATTTKELTS